MAYDAGLDESSASWTERAAPTREQSVTRPASCPSASGQRQWLVATPSSNAASKLETLSRVPRRAPAVSASGWLQHTLLMRRASRIECRASCVVCSAVVMRVLIVLPHMSLTGETLLVSRKGTILVAHVIYERISFRPSSM
jgi:hypothetical protein